MIGFWSRQEDLRALGTAVRELRARRGVSQEALGDQAGLHRNYVGAIERGEINPTFRVLLQLCGGLGVLPCELVEMYQRNRMAQLGIVTPSDPEHGRTSGRRSAGARASVVDAGQAGPGSADGRALVPPSVRSAEPPAPRLHLAANEGGTR